MKPEQRNKCKIIEDPTTNKIKRIRNTPQKKGYSFSVVTVINLDIWLNIVGTKVVLLVKQTC